MRQKLEVIAERRQNLLLTIAAQRTVLAQDMEPVRKPLAIADRGLQIISYFKQHPVLMLGATTLFGIIRTKRLGKWLQTGWAAFQLVRNGRSWLLKK